MTQSIGPPSLAQGTRIAVGFSTSISRFIPACAGNSTSTITFLAPMAVHPRLRGELLLLPLPHAQNTGSSPLTRGTHVLSLVINDTCRFIPAYAGNSLIRRPTKTAKSVHPRLRGELGLNHHVDLSVAGSSPLTRGTRY